MIEILNKTDVNKIQDKQLKDYLEYSLKRLPENFDYPNDGYFIVIQTLDELQTNKINLTNHSLNGINNGLLDDINMVEIKDEIIEILVFVDNDISLSFVMPIKILPITLLEQLEEYVI